MRKAIYLSLLLPAIILLMALTVEARGKPDWVKNFGESKKYDRDKYIIGFGSAAGSSSMASESAQDNARFDAASTIVVDIRGRILTVKEEAQQEFSQHLSSITESSTSLKLMGLNIETHEDDDPPTAYALAFVSNADLKRVYSARKSELLRQIRQITIDAEEAEGNSQKLEAATKYLSLYPLYEELKEAETILLVVGHSASVENAFMELNRATGNIQAEVKPLMMWSAVSKKIDQLLLDPPVNVDDVAKSIIIQLSRQVGDMNGQALIMPFTYQDKKMTSLFARYLRSAIKKELGKMSDLKWEVVSLATDFKPTTRETTSELARASGAQWVLSGTYWEQDDKIKVMSSLRDVDTKKVLAGADILFDKEILAVSGIDLRPENYDQALQEQSAFSEGEIISSKLQVDVFTNKGKDNVLLTEGEVMKIYVRVNRPAYLRLLYVLADGTRTLLPVDPDTSKLHDNYYIDESRINRVVEIPAEFECAQPFGAEMLIVVARTKEFPPIETEEIGGYYFLKASSPKEAAYKTRGLKLRRQKPDGIEQTEAKLVITTMAD